MDKIKISRFIKQLRIDENLTQEKFVEEFTNFLGYKGDKDAVSIATVSKWERGDSFPNMQNIEDLADFYLISVDEIFNGERNTDIDYSKKYFIANPVWGTEYAKDPTANLWEIKNEQELLIEKTFNDLLCKMIDNTITSNEEKEFDFIVNNFYNLNQSKTLEETKFLVREKCSLMHKSTLEEKLWEAYKFFDYKEKIDFYKDLCDNIHDGGAEMIAKRLFAERDVDKDILLAYVQKNNVIHRYGIQSKELFEKKFNEKYDEEKLTKQVIKFLIENGACLNDTLLGYYEKMKTKRNIIDTLILGYVQYKKPINIVVVENGKRKYCQIQNTKKNREHDNLKYDTRFDYYIKESELKDLEKRLYDGETEYIEESTYYWVGIDDAFNKESKYVDSYYEEDNKDYIEDTVKDLSYNTFLSGRCVEKTQSLLNDLDILSLTEIREKYFTMEMREDEWIH